jgi:hypothetical protein
MKVYINNQVMNLPIRKKSIWQDRTNIIDIERDGELIIDNNNNAYDIYMTYDKSLVLIKCL